MQPLAGARRAQPPKGLGRDHKFAQGDRMIGNLYDFW
jgi:hypothetical protein